MFELKVGDQIVNLKWGTYAMKLLCARMGIGIDDFFKLLADLAENVTNQKAFTMLENFLHAGYEAANKAKVSDEEVCDWIDKLGGVANVNNSQFVDYINYVIGLTLTGVTPLPGDSELTEKKKEE
jgi:hypothetical protein